MKCKAKVLRATDRHRRKRRPVERANWPGPGRHGIPSLL